MILIDIEKNKIYKKKGESIYYRILNNSIYKSLCIEDWTLAVNVTDIRELKELVYEYDATKFKVELKDNNLKIVLTQADQEVEIDYSLLIDMAMEVRKKVELSLN